MPRTTAIRLPRTSLTVALLLALVAAMLTVVAGPANATEGTGPVAFVNQPSNAVVGDPLTDDEDDPLEVKVTTSGELRVILGLQRALRAINVLDHDVVTIEVELELGVPDELSGELAGDTTGDATDGSATFLDVAIDAKENGLLGRGYELEATATTKVETDELGDSYFATLVINYLDGFDEVEVGTDTSAPFALWGSGENCTLDDCTPAELNKVLSEGRGIDVSLALDGLTGRQLLAFTSDALLPDDACGEDTVGLDTTVLFETLTADSGTATVQVTFDRAAASSGRPAPGVGRVGVCYVGDKEFVAADGTEMDTPNGLDDVLKFGPALLPDCNKVGDVAPCVAQRRAFGRSGVSQGQITLLVPAGDPMFRFR